MPEINLLKNEIKNRNTISLRRIGSKAVYFIGALAGLELLIYLGLAIFNQNIKRTIAETERQATAIDVEINQLESDRQHAISLQKRINNIAGLLANHGEWTTVLAELEKYTYKLATYNTMQVDEVKHNFSFTGTVGSYTDLGRLMLGLSQSNNFSNIQFKSSAQDDSGAGGYSFDIEVEFNPKLLTSSD